ncbi:MAG: transposase [Oceanospirillales bacterium]|nr:transposase [Oceanospirillales bacterium]MBR9887061.1 transposase [Oceanospirillales bacterium]
MNIDKSATKPAKKSSWHEWKHWGRWQRTEVDIKPYYPKSCSDRRPYPLTIMLRIHCLQQWFSLSDPAMEDPLYDIA